MMIAWLLISVAFATPGKPRCDGLPVDWVKNVKSVCDNQFKKEPPPPDGATADHLCGCVADSIGNDLSCEELKRYRTDHKFAVETQKRIAQVCLHRSTSKYP